MFLIVFLPLKVEAKTKTVSYNIDKISANNFVKDVQSKGKKAVFVEKDKTKYEIKLVVKATSKSDGRKKVNTFAKKVMKAKDNTYGLSYGIKVDEYNYEKYNKKKKIYSETLYCTCNDIYYLNAITKNALSQEYLEMEDCDEDGDYAPYIIDTQKIFPDAASFKKCSESVKAELILEYMGGLNGMTYDDKKVAVTWKNIYLKKSRGVCKDFAEMYAWAIRMIAYNYDYELEVNMKANHEVVLITVKNSNNCYDYFEGNNDGFTIFRINNSSKIDTNIATTTSLDQWMELEPKEYKNSLLEIAAYKYGKALTPSELHTLIIHAGGIQA